MKEKRLYYLIIGITVVLIFATAAVCNQCQQPLEDMPGNGEGSAQDDEEAIASEGQESQQSQTTDETGAGTEDDGAEEPGEPEENISPFIENVIVSSEDMPSMPMHEYGMELSADTQYYIAIEAYDDDGDDINYSVSCIGGDIMGLAVIDNNNAECIWISPEEEADCIISITASDTSGGVDSMEISIHADGTESLGDEDDEPEAMGESLVGIGADDRLSGSIVEGEDPNIAGDSSGAPSIYVGDTATIKKSKGYLSFDVSDLAGSTVLNAWFTARDTDKSGDPLTLGSDLLLFSNDYGDSLEADDNSTRGTRIASFAADSESLACSNEILVEEIQEKLNDSEDYFQLKLAYLNENGNGNSDGLIIYLSNISLEISYR